MSRPPSTLWQVLLPAIFASLAALQRAANAQNMTPESLVTTVVASTTTNSASRLPVSPTSSPPAITTSSPSAIATPSPTPQNPCRMFEADLNPCGLEPDKLYYYSNVRAESEFLQYMAIISTLTNLTDDTTANCGARLAQFACRYLFPRCNAEMMPMAPCQNYCKCTLQDTCQDQWVLISETIDNMFGSYTSDFTDLINEISDRGKNCTDLEAYSNEVNYTMCDGSLECIYPSPAPSPSSTPVPSTPVLAIVGGALGAFFLLLLVGICLITFFCCYKRNRKMSEAFSFHKDTADYLQSGDSSILRLARIHKRKSKFKSPRELLKQVPALYSELMVHNAEYLIQESRIQTTSFLAEGAFSEVYLGNIIDLQPYDTSTFRSVVIKRFKDGTSDADIVRYLEMCLSLGSVSHPNVMTIIGISFNAIGAFSMIYPYLGELDLFTHLRKKRSNIASGKELQEFSVDTLVQMVFQICQGMKAISRMRIVYKTLCAHACMVNIDKNQQQVIVGDPSFSKLKDFSEKQGSCASPHNRWLAPESILDGEFTEKSDVWSFGITCWEVFSFGSQPFADEDYSATPTRKKLPQPPFCPDLLFSIVQGCWNKNAKERPSFADLAVRFDTLLARTSYQGQVTEMDKEIRSGARRLAALPTVHSTRSLDQQQKVFEPASAQPEQLETSLKTAEGYLKVIGDQDDDTAGGYSSFASTNQYQNNVRLHPLPVVDIGNDEDPYGYVNVTPEPPSQTATVLHEREEAQHKPVTHTEGDGHNVTNRVYDNLEGVATSSTSPNQSKSTKALLLEEDTGFRSKTDSGKAKKPAPLPKPSFPGGLIS